MEGRGREERGNDEEIILPFLGLSHRILELDRPLMLLGGFQAQLYLRINWGNLGKDEIDK